MSILEWKKPLAIANLFQCCLDDLSSIVTEWSKHNPGGLDDSDVERCKEQLGRLKIWDDEVKASSGNLDHDLRRSPELRAKVIKLLKQLIEALETGMCTSN
jgi:hypothetical protein